MSFKHCAAKKLSAKYSFTHLYMKSKSSIAGIRRKYKIIISEFGERILELRHTHSLIDIIAQRDRLSTLRRPMQYVT